MKKSASALLAVMVLGIASSHAALYTLSGSMDPQQAGTNGGFGGGSGNGTGTIIGQYDDVTNLLDYTITFANLSSGLTNAHFHLGAPGVSGGVQLGIPFTSGVTSGTLSGSNVLVSDTNELNLLAGNWYVNLHTLNFGSGEIRGQVSVAPVPEPGVSVFGMAAAGLLLLRRRRQPA